MNRKLKTMKALRTVYYLPAILSTLVVGLVFNALFDSRHGTINTILNSIGLKNWILPWLGSRWPAVFAICTAEVWRNVFRSWMTPGSKRHSHSRQKDFKVV